MINSPTQTSSPGSFFYPVPPPPTPPHQTGDLEHKIRDTAQEAAGITHEADLRFIKLDPQKYSKSFVDLIFRPMRTADEASRTNALCSLGTEPPWALPLQDRTMDCRAHWRPGPNQAGRPQKDRPAYNHGQPL